MFRNNEMRGKQTEGTIHRNSPNPDHSLNGSSGSVNGDLQFL